MSKFKLDLDQIKRARMAVLLGFHEGSPDSWPIDLIDRLIAGEQKNGFEWLMSEIKRVAG